MSLACTFALAALLLSPASALAQTDGDVLSQLDQMFGSADPFVEAFQAVQGAVEAGDADAVAEWVAYPLRAKVDGEETEIADPAAFVEYYDRIVTEEVAEVVVNQRFADLFVNAEGVMFGSGEVWMTLICRDDACAAADARIVTVQSIE